MMSRNAREDEAVLGAAAGGDAEELAGLEAFLVVAGPGVDSAADEQAADEIFGGHAVAQLDQDEVGAGGIGVETGNHGERRKKRREWRM